ncbi:MAG: GreA/GreB family elongation factor [Candidatus Levybacteria bacterium]|nr:GreA/GreB family elongation factor [Candidatus Levybacteria bacterium]
MKKIKFTKEGFEKLKKNFEEFTQKRKSTVANLSRAREMGDLSENGAYKSAKFELGSIDRELRRLKYLLRFGFIAESSKRNFVDFGSKVILSDGEKEMIFTMVSGYESDPHEQKLSTFSPLGKAILGKRKGDRVEVISPSGKTIYKIVDFK